MQQRSIRFGQASAATALPVAPASAVRPLSAASRRWATWAGGALVAVAMWMAGTAPAGAQAYPSRPVKLIAPYAAGGPTDAMARLLAVEMAKSLGQPVVVENRPGASGAIGADVVAKSPPDGYTVCFCTTGPTVLMPLLEPKLPYALRDLAPVGLVHRVELSILLGPKQAAKNIAELIAYAKANPGKLTYSSSGIGGGTHLAGELFASMTGTKLLHVPYKGSAPAMADLLGGQVNLMFSDAPTATEHIKAGKIRALGISTKARSALMPDLPTIAEAGVPGYESNSWTALVAPAGTPAQVVARVNADMVKVLNDPATRDRLLKVGAEPMPGTPEDLGRFLRAEIAKWSKIIREADIKPE